MVTALASSSVAGSPSGRFRELDPDVLAVLVVSGGVDDGGSCRFRRRQRGEGGRLVPTLAQALGDVQEHVRFVPDD